MNECWGNEAIVLKWGGLKEISEEAKHGGQISLNKIHRIGLADLGDVVHVH